MWGERIKQDRNGKKILDAIGDLGLKKRDFALTFDADLCTLLFRRDNDVHDQHQNRRISVPPSKVERSLSSLSTTCHKCILQKKIREIVLRPSLPSNVLNSTFYKAR
jgi:hypothetical protein